MPVRWNLLDVYITHNSGGINITGYGPLANVSGPPKFKPENIVLLANGHCGSTCTIFSEFMTKQAGVKTIAMGGRSNKNPMRAVGGVKGREVYDMRQIQQIARNAIAWTPSLANSSLKHFQDDYLFSRFGRSRVNFRNGLRQNDDSGIPLQFLYEEADCRLYYTPEMTFDITFVWKVAADAQWGNSDKCIGRNADSRKHEDHGVTSRLGTARLHVSHADALKQLEAFERSFSLKTDSKLMATDSCKHKGPRLSVTATRNILSFGDRNFSMNTENT